MLPRCYSNFDCSVLNKLNNNLVTLEMDGTLRVYYESHKYMQMQSKL